MTDLSSTSTRKQSKGPSSVPISEADLQKHSQELGYLGRIFGSKEHAPVYIAGAVAMFAMIGICIAAFMPEKTDFSRADVIKSLAGIVLATLTFLGGVYSGSRR